MSEILVRGEANPYSRAGQRFGLGLGADTAPDMLSAAVDQLEACGVDSLWFSELVSAKAVDPFVGMAYALARTTQLKVRTSVAVLPGRDPVLVAKQLASLAGLAPQRALSVFGLRSAIPAERVIFPVPDGQRIAGANWPPQPNSAAPC